MNAGIEKGLAHADQTRVVEVGRGLLARTGAIVGEALGVGDASVLVVADERTWRAAGAVVDASLRASGLRVQEALIFPGTPALYAAYEHCETIRERLRATGSVAVAVGAGTLNDLVKRAAFELGRPYMVVCTAASMDGYTAFGASIALDGFKNTRECTAPRGCVADYEILAAAPQVMTASGYGDLIGKLTAGADWIVADAVGTEAMDQAVWEQVQGPLHGSLSRPEALANGDVSATGDLAEGLLMSGLAMQGHQSSRPASGSEHQFSHLWEMEGHGVDVTPRRLSHGFKVALGTVAMTALYEALLRRDITSLDVDAAVAAWPTRERAEEQVRELNPGSSLIDEMMNQSMAKYIDADQLRARLDGLKQQWPTLSEKLRAQLLPATQVQQMLRTVGAPAHPDDIDLEWDRFHQTYFRARMIRKRYTVLDLVNEAGLLDELVAELFAPDGFWGTQKG